MKKIPDSLTPIEAWRRLSASARMPNEMRELTSALDHHLAEDVHALHDVPRRARSFMDGFAVRSEDTRTVPVQLKIAGEVFMGVRPDRRLHSGEAMIIPTGGYLPDGADAVLMQEDAEVNDTICVARNRVEAGENVHSAGEDFRAGQKLFAAGHRLRPQDLAAIGTFGISRVKVICRPRISVVSTGNELVPFSTQHHLGDKIRETNSLALAAACRKFLFEVQRREIVPDELEAQRIALERSLQEADVVLISGGSSVGARDYTLEAIRSFPEYRIHFHGLAIRPGHPTIFASVGSRWVFGLPGQPASSLIVFYQFVLPFLLFVSGEEINYESYPEGRVPVVSAWLEAPVKRLKARTDYVRVQVTTQGDDHLALPVPGKSASVSTLALADGYAIVEPGHDAIEKGTRIPVILFP